MLNLIRTFIQENPGATNFAVAAEFNLTRAMTDRYLEYLEDTGDCFLDRPADVCTGCAPKPAADASDACSTSGAASKINALAARARSRKGSIAEPML
jgi:hypothetical protein